MVKEREDVGEKRRKIKRTSFCFFMDMEWAPFVVKYDHYYTPF